MFIHSILWWTYVPCRKCCCIINKLNIILVGCIVWPVFLYVLSSIPGMIIFIICCLPLIGCSVLIGPTRFVDWPFCINLMISARHNNLIVPARKFIFIYFNIHILIFLCIDKILHLTLIYNKCIVKLGTIQNVTRDTKKKL